MQRGASQRSSEDPTVRQRGTVSNQGGRGNPSSETDHRNAQASLGDHCKGWKQMRALLFHKFLQPLSWALGKECMVQRSRRAGVPLRHSPQWQPIGSCFPAVSTCPQTGSPPAFSDLQWRSAPVGLEHHIPCTLRFRCPGCKKHPDKDTHTSDSMLSTSYTRHSSKYFPGFKSFDLYPNPRR